MLWTLLKILIFIAVVSAAIYGIDLLSAQSGGIRITVAGTEYSLGPVQAVIAALVLLAVVWLVLQLIGLVLALLRFLAGDETAITRFFGRRGQRRGYEALSDGLRHLASGEPDLAMAKAAKAEKLLRRSDLTNLLTAQAAEMTGNTAKTTQAYKRLLADEKTRFVGVRGLMKQKLAEGDTDLALKLAEKAFVLKPRHAETSDTLLQLQAGKSNWVGARRTLKAKRKYGTIPQDLHRRRDAVLAVSEAEQRLDAGDHHAARDLAVEAHRLAPSLVPAAVAAARAYIADSKPRNAAQALKDTWKTNPHPDLAAAFAEIEPDETPSARLKRFEDLIRVNPSDPETQMLMAELNIAAENFPGARRALGDLAEKMPNARTATLMAAIERGEGGDDSTVKAWLAKALTASRGPQWICDNCGTIHRGWLAVCGNCGAFDSLSWKAAPVDADSISGASMGMLPLIVGSVEDRRGDAGPDGDAAEPTPGETSPEPEIEYDIDASASPGNGHAASPPRDPRSDSAPPEDETPDETTPVASSEDEPRPTEPRTLN